MVTKEKVALAPAGTQQQRRRWPRLRLALPIFVRGTDDQGKPFLDLATALNVSAGGALLVLKRYVKAGAELSLEIPISSLPSALLPQVVRRLQARLLRVETAGKCCLVGVEFTEPLAT
jgi:hypothetical protein